MSEAYKWAANRIGQLKDRVQELEQQNTKLVEALERIETFSDYLDGRDGCTRMQDIARESLEVQGEV